MGHELSKADQETIITYNRASNMAQMHTFTKAEKSKFIKAGYEPTNSESDGFGSQTFEFPKKCIKIQLRPRKLSTETRKKRSQQMTAINRKRADSKKVLLHAH